MHRNRDGFTLALKIDDKQCKFSICMDDDQDMLFEKLVQIYPQCANRREEILQKLRTDLETKIENSNVKICLKAAIHKFLDATFYSKSQFVLSSNKKNVSPEKSKSKAKLQRYSPPKSKSKSKENISTPVQAVESFSLPRKSEDLKQNKSSNKVKRKEVRPRSAMNKQSPNEDVVKACQVILERTKQGEIKSMARKYLKEIGRLPSDQMTKSKKLAQQIKEEDNEGNAQQQVHVSNVVGVSKVEYRGEEASIVQQKGQPNEAQSRVNSRPNYFCSPIQGINNNTERKANQSLASGVQINQFKYNYNQPGSFRGNRYNYLQSMETALEPSDLSHHNTLSIVREAYRPKKYSYLCDIQY